MDGGVVTLVTMYGCSMHSAGQTPQDSPRVWPAVPAEAGRYSTIRMPIAPFCP